MLLRRLAFPLLALLLAGSGGAQGAAKETGGGRVRHAFGKHPFHLHLNSWGVVRKHSKLGRELERLGLRKDNFTGAPKGVETTKPRQHWTREYTLKEKALWQQHATLLHDLVDKFGYRGYIEAENVPVEIRLNNKSQNPKGPVEPFP